MLIVAGLLVFNCAGEKKTHKTSDAFKATIDGKKTDIYTLKNKNGVTIKITNYGGRIVDIIVPDRNGKFGDIALGYDSIQKYVNYPEMYLGATIGRYANRIDRGKFTLDGKQYQLDINDGRNSLHGGSKGFFKQVWDVVSHDSTKLVLKYVSPDMEMGYPGQLTAVVTFTLDNNNAMTIDYKATTTKPTIVNMTNHTYYNLGGEGSGTINNELLTINANHYTPIDSNFIPTGVIAPVAGTPFDFRKPKAIGQDINDKNIQLHNGHGYDHNFVLNDTTDSMHFAARVVDTANGRTLTIYTTQPGIQFYGGNFMDGSTIGKSGKPYKYREAFCLETQHYPDSPNEPNFPSVVLRPGQTYHTVSKYVFGVKK